MDHSPFLHQPKCSAAGCDRHALYKVASPWTYGDIRELKNYGLCCEAHRDELFSQAKARAERSRPSEGETVGPVGVYQILPGVRDADLTRIE